MYLFICIYLLILTMSITPLVGAKYVVEKRVEAEGKKLIQDAEPEEAGN